MSIQANIQAVQDAYDAVKAHCMCLAIHDDGCVIRVIYPSGDWPQGLDGVQCSYGVTYGKAEALNRILARMEADWLNSFPGRA